MENQSYHKLIVYQKSKQLVIIVYQITNQFPKSEQFSLVPQIRRASISIPANIVEGYSKSSTKDFIRFLDISLGSLAELEFYLELCQELKYLDQNNYNRLAGLSLEVRKLLRSFQKSLRQRL